MTLIKCLVARARRQILQSLHDSSGERMNLFYKVNILYNSDIPIRVYQLYARQILPQVCGVKRCARSNHRRDLLNHSKRLRKGEVARRSLRCKSIILARLESGCLM
jgi:hypothetical protein